MQKHDIIVTGLFTAENLIIFSFRGMESRNKHPLALLQGGGLKRGIVSLGKPRGNFLGKKGSPFIIGVIR